MGPPAPSQLVLSRASFFWRSRPAHLILIRVGVGESGHAASFSAYNSVQGWACLGRHRVDNVALRTSLLKNLQQPSEITAPQMRYRLAKNEPSFLFHSRLQELLHQSSLVANKSSITGSCIFILQIAYQVYHRITVLFTSGRISSAESVLSLAGCGVLRFDSPFLSLH